MNNSHETIFVIVYTFPEERGLGTLERYFKNSTSVGELRIWVASHLDSNDIRVRFISNTSELVNDESLVQDVVPKILMQGDAYVLQAVLLEAWDEETRKNAVLRTSSYSDGKTVSINQAAGEKIANTLVALGETSPYISDEGTHATSKFVSLAGAFTLLRRRREYGEQLGLSNGAASSSNREITDSIVLNGENLYKEWKRMFGDIIESTSVDFILNCLPTSHDYPVSLMVHGEDFGNVSRDRNNTNRNFRKSFQRFNGKACVITRSSESVLVLLGENRSPSYLFDSHPRPPQLAYPHILRFKTLNDLTLTLCSRFSQNLSALPKKEAETEDIWRLCALDLRTSHENRSFASKDVLKAEALQDDSLQSNIAPISEAEMRILTCPITLELFADPVSTVDGQMYERNMIQEHFRVERESFLHQVDFETEDDHCAGERQVRRFHTSPNTGAELIHTRLIPCYNIVSLIENYINQGRISTDIAEEWKGRRERALKLADEHSEVVQRYEAMPDEQVVGIKTGWLLLRSAGDYFFNDPEPKFFVLTAQSLFSYTNERAQGPDIGMFKLKSSTNVRVLDNRLFITSPEIPGKAREARISLDVPDKTLTDETLLEWETAINQAISKQKDAAYVPSSENVRVISESIQQNSSFCGLALGLCEGTELISIFGVRRCMIRSCALEFSTDSSHVEDYAIQCRRCGRVVCEQCGFYSVLSFKEAVIDSNETYEVGQLHYICFECFEDAVDILERRALVGHELEIRNQLLSKLTAHEEAEIERKTKQEEERITMEYSLMEMRLISEHEKRKRELDMRISRAQSATRYAEQAENGIDSVTEGENISLTSPKILEGQIKETDTEVLRTKLAHYISSLHDDVGSEEEYEIALEISKVNAEIEEAELNIATEISISEVEREEEEEISPMKLDSLSIEKMRTQMTNIESQLQNVTDSEDQMELALKLSEMVLQIEEYELKEATDRSQNLNTTNDYGAGNERKFQNNQLTSTQEKVEELREKIRYLSIAQEEAGDDNKRFMDLCMEQIEAMNALEQAVLALALEQSVLLTSQSDLEYTRNLNDSGENNENEDYGYEDVAALGIRFPTERGAARILRVRNQVSARTSGIRAQRELEANSVAENRDLEIHEKTEELLKAEGMQSRAEENFRAARIRREEHQRVLRKQQEERERLAREAENLDRQREEQRLKREKEAERATIECLQRVGGETGSDLRMCRSCRSGPYDNPRCRDLASHNDDGVNRCKNCRWFDEDWHNWPLWDGVHGPH